MTRPSVGKAGTHGKFLVEVVQSSTGTRSFARRFVEEGEARDFHTRSVAAHQQKANRERHGYLVVLYETETPRSPPKDSEVLVTEAVTPH